MKLMMLFTLGLFIILVIINQVIINTQFLTADTSSIKLMSRNIQVFVVWVSTLMHTKVT